MKKRKIKTPSPRSLSNLALRLIQKDLQAIECLDLPEDKLTPEDAATLTRYYVALVGQRKLDKKAEDATRKQLSKMSINQLKIAAGIESAEKTKAKKLQSS